MSIILFLNIFFFCLFVSFILFLLSFFLVYQKMEVEKFSSYECGFNPFGDARSKFEVKFYLVGILFIIFDLEIAFLFPWAVAIREVGLIGFISMALFLVILTVGFIYEWKKGALDWD